MNVEIGAEAALFQEKEYISRIFVAVHLLSKAMSMHVDSPVPAPSQTLHVWEVECPVHQRVDTAIQLTGHACSPHFQNVPPLKFLKYISYFKF